MAEPQYRFTNRPDAATMGTGDQAERARRSGSNGPDAHAPAQPDDAFRRQGELLEFDPGATVATSAVQPPPSQPPRPQYASPSGPQSASGFTAAPTRVSTTTGDLPTQGFGQVPGQGLPQAFVPGPSQAFVPDVLRDSVESFPTQGTHQTVLPAYHPESDELPGGMYIDATELVDDYGVSFGAQSAIEGDDDLDDLADMADDDEWALADQPTANLGRDALARSLSSAWLTADEPTAWPQAPAPDLLGGPRLASPDGNLMPMTPPTGIPRSAFANPRVERFQELRELRKTHERGERAPQDPSPVTERVHTWWMDLTPGLQRALKLQHEARESGLHPVPGYVATVATAVIRMTDAFGRLAISTRELANRAHATAAPALRRMHESAEAAAQALIDKLDGAPVEQQASFLGPGRLAVLFKSGVTVGQAQRLLQGVNARPLRLIPRKHGFLAMVGRGTEAQVAARLRQHPWVRDVIYMEYDDPSQSLSVEVPAIMGTRRG